MKFQLPAYILLFCSLVLFGCENTPEEATSPSSVTETASSPSSEAEASEADTTPQPPEEETPETSNNEEDDTQADTEEPATQEKETTVEIAPAEAIAPAPAPVVVSPAPAKGDGPVINPEGEAPIKTGTVIFPNGREILEIGETYTLRWDTDGVELVDLKLYNYGRPYATVATGVRAFDKKYEWTPQESILRDNDFASLTFVVLDTKTGEKYDESNAPFVVQRSAPE